MSNSLNLYLQRIHYTGSLTPTLDTLRALHRAHLLAISYENLDIHLGRALPLDEDYIFDKIVRRGRGGWCYEMNGLFAWALRQIGFEVKLLASLVGGRPQGDDADFDHLILRVELDAPWLADVGFGNAFLEPLPFAEGEHQQNGFTYRLEKLNPLDPSEWFFHSHTHGGKGYGFYALPHNYQAFAPRCRWLQTSPESGFVKLTVCHRFTPDGILSLRGAILKTVTPTSASEETIERYADYEKAILDTFGLNLSKEEVESLWSRVWPNHVAWMKQIATA